ncbi:MAG: hypothetical protein ABFR65_11110 [Pseudomonadota bacterium]
MAAWQGNSGIAIGNAIGSNIANMALVLGVAAGVTLHLLHLKTLATETVNEQPGRQD